MPFGPGHYVYRLWSGDGRCLYIGSAGGRGKPVPLTERLRRAYRDNDWAGEVARYDWAALATAEDAAAEEREQIRRLRPVYNLAMSVCRAGLHDVTLPGSQTADGKCAECTQARMAVYMPQWRKQNPGKTAEYTARYRERVGEEEWKRRYRRYSRESREREIYRGGGIPMRVVWENHRSAARVQLLLNHERTNRAIADLVGCGYLVVRSVRLELEAEGRISQYRAKQGRPPAI